MKNNLLDLKSFKTCSIDDRIPANNDYLELMGTHKLEEGEFTNINESFERNFFDEYEESICFDDDLMDEVVDSAVWERLQGDREVESLSFLYAGYVDCMDEAIRFLIEEENISPEHPVVTNLKAYLEKSKERLVEELNLVNILPSTKNLRSADFPLGRVRHCRDSG
ncbi:hypothetical protein RUM44_009057 [Polyplax serrata]|uniref:Uncharacterized protein n=1 Tax=Polyplax serrata TaxID=468196 RepID=A0ABR1ARU8_POLSC